MSSGICAWHRNFRLQSNYAHIHITKADYRMESGYMQWVFSPRIGLDFRHKPNKRGQQYIPNIDVGELIRMIKVLKILQSRKVFKSIAEGRRNNFVILQTPGRRMRFVVFENQIELQYRHTGWTSYLSMGSMSTNRTEAFRKMLNNALVSYLKLMEEWIRTGNLPEGYRHKVSAM